MNTDFYSSQLSSSKSKLAQVARRSQAGRWGRVGVLALLFVASQAVSPSAYAESSTVTKPRANVEITEKARRLFEAGVDFIQDPDGARYGEAYRSFKAAYEESPSWKILGNLGISAMKIERDGEALDALEAYLEAGRSDLDDDEIKQVERDVRTLRASTTWVEITTNVSGATAEDTRVPLSGEHVSNRYEFEGSKLRIGVHNGNHTISIKKPGYAAQSWTFTASGEDLTHDFVLAVETKPQPTASDSASTKDPETARPVPVLTWITIGTTAAFTAGAVVTGVMALDKQKQFDEENGNDEEVAKKLRKSGQTLNLTTDILIGAAVVSAAVATISYFTRPTVVVEPKDNAVSWTPVALRGGGGLVLSGSF